MSVKTVKKLLIEFDLSPTKLAQRLGYSRQHITNIINGQSRSKKVEGQIMSIILEEYLNRLDHNEQ